LYIENNDEWKEGGNVAAASCSNISMMKPEEFDPALPFIHAALSMMRLI